MDPDTQDSAMGNLLWLSECGVCGNHPCQVTGAVPNGIWIQLRSLTATVAPAWLDREVSLTKTQEFLHPVPKFQPKILGVIFVHLQTCTAKGTQHNVDKSVQNICCETSFGSAKAEFVRRALGWEFMVAFPHSYGNSPSVGCRACRVHLSCSSPFIWHSAPTGGQESENRLCYDRDLQIL